MSEVAIARPSVHARSRNTVEIVNVADNSVADDDFLDLSLDRPVRWTGLSGLPSNAIERHVRGIRVSRYRGAWQASRALRPGRVLVSHLPLMSAAAATAMKLLDRQAPHLAFSFTFTNRPTGARLAYMRRALASVDQFAVYSQYERGLYADLFDFDADLFQPVIWTQTAPNPDPAITQRDARPYYCAVGGEGRDIATILEVAKSLPKALRVVIVARPHSVAGLSIPDNVEVHTNIPAGQTWALAQGSLGVLLPLLSENTCCGHITLVSAKQLGIPVATTRAFATREYVEGRGGIIECEPADPLAFATLMERLADEQPTLRQSAQQDRAAEVAFHDRAKWARYVSEFLDKAVPDIRSGNA